MLYNTERGCYWHPCDKCDTAFHSDEQARILKARNDADRAEFLERHLDQYIIMEECVYRSQMQNDPAYTNFFWNKDRITENDIIQGILNGEVYGLCKVDITCPDDAKKKYLDLNFAPIFRHVEVTEEMLTEEYLKYARSRNAKFPLDPQLTLTFNAQNIILATPLLKYYMDNGLKIEKVHYFVEYLPGEPFRPFIDKMVNMRIKATDDDNQLHQNLAKILMNSRKPG